MILRPMAESDIDRVYDIERAVNSFPWSLKQLLSSYHSSDQCTVAWGDNTVIGYTIFSAVLDEATLLNIAVSPDYQGKGYGGKLLWHGLSVLNQHGIVTCYLEVRVSNTNALSLYRSAGFTQVGVREGYYPAINGREDALVMSRQLPATNIGDS